MIPKALHWGQGGEEISGFLNKRKTYHGQGGQWEDVQLSPGVPFLGASLRRSLAQAWPPPPTNAMFQTHLPFSQPSAAQLNQGGNVRTWGKAQVATLI